MQEEIQSEKKRKKEIENLYAKAEKSVQKGNLDEAEQTLKEASEAEHSAIRHPRRKPMIQKRLEAQNFYTNAKVILGKRRIARSRRGSKENTFMFFRFISGHSSCFCRSRISGKNRKKPKEPSAS